MTSKDSAAMWASLALDRAGVQLADMPARCTAGNVLPSTPAHTAACQRQATPGETPVQRRNLPTSRFADPPRLTADFPSPLAEVADWPMHLAEYCQSPDEVKCSPTATHTHPESATPTADPGIGGCYAKPTLPRLDQYALHSPPLHVHTAEPSLSLISHRLPP